MAARLVLFFALLIGSNAWSDIKGAALDGLVPYSRWSGSPSFAGEPIGFGGQPEPAAMARLAENGYATVINLRFPDEEGADIDAERDAAKQAGLKFISLPFHPEKSPAGTIEKIVSTLGDSRNQPVFLHCKTGTRAAMVWMVGRVKIDDLDAQAAKREGELIAGKPDKAIMFIDAYLSSEGAKPPAHAHQSRQGLSDGNLTDL